MQLECEDTQIVITFAGHDEAKYVCLDKCLDKTKVEVLLPAPEKKWNDVLLSDTQCLNIRRPYTVAQKKKSAWKAKTGRRTHLAYARRRCNLISFVKGTCTASLCLSKICALGCDVV